jgi:hypothetical protein
MEMRIQEYETLRNELLQNKQYVFERPLIIITAAGVAAVQLSDKPSVLLLPILLITLLLINLWFTVNRLKSIARIAAYISVVLESAPKTWIGWESALREHRIWIKSHNPEEQEKILANHIKSEAIPDAMMFYGPLFLLHVVTVLIAFAVSAISLAEGQGVTQIGSFIVTFVATGVFSGYCIGPYHPKKMRDLIEVQRAIWIEALKIDVKVGNRGGTPGAET